GLPDQGLEGRPVGVLEHQVRPVPDLVRVVGGDNVRVVEPRRRPDLALERLPGGRGPGQVRVEHLDRHRPVHRSVLGPVHPAPRPPSSWMTYWPITNPSARPARRRSAWNRVRYPAATRASAARAAVRASGGSDSVARVSWAGVSRPALRTAARRVVRSVSGW